jgi:hypothetical protein
LTLLSQALLTDLIVGINTSKKIIPQSLLRDVCSNDTFQKSSAKLNIMPPSQEIFNFLMMKIKNPAIFQKKNHDNFFFPGNIF